MAAERACVTCGVGDDAARLERCGICTKSFCAEHAHRALGGRRFCSPECGRAYYFHGESDDDDEDTGHDD